MLYLKIPESEIFVEDTNEFVQIHERTLCLEHSLVSLSKWESKWHKAFLASEKTDLEMLDYIKCMTISQNVPEYTYLALTEDHITQIAEYINDPMTATWFNESHNRPSRDTVTAELIYYWMIANNIPPEYRKWHLNQLLTLIRVCNIKNEPPKKMSKKEITSRNAALNAARRKALNTKG